MSVSDLFLGGLLVCAPALLVPGVLALAHWSSRRFARFGRLATLAWLAGILGLIPGLGQITHYPETGCMDICFETATETRGWPFDWQGFNGVGNILAPLRLLGDVAVVALVALVGLGLAELLARRCARPRVGAGIAAALVLVFALFPLWGKPMADLAVLVAATPTPVWIEVTETPVQTRTPARIKVTETPIPTR